MGLELDLLLRDVAMIFDACLQVSAASARHSRAI